MKRRSVCYPHDLKLIQPFPIGLAFLFDMDGVVIDSNPIHTEAWLEYLKRHNVVVPDIFARMHGKRNDEIVHDFFGSGLSGAEIARHGAEKERLYREMMAPQMAARIVPGLEEFLEEARGVPKALVSNAEPENVSFVLRYDSLASHFPVVVDGHQVVRPKPAPDIYLRAAARLRAEARNCIVFEDSDAGVNAALGAGMRVVGVRTTQENFSGTHLVIDDFRSEDLRTWLSRQEALTD